MLFFNLVVTIITAAPSAIKIHIFVVAENHFPAGTTIVTARKTLKLT